MEKEALYRLAKYLEDKRIYSVSGDDEIKKRKRGKQYTYSDHLRGLIYALLTNQREWSVIIPKLPKIDKLFFNYDYDEIKKHPGEYYLKGILSLSAGNISIKAQMMALHENMDILKKIERKYGSLDKYVTSKDPEKIVKELSSSGSEYKIKQLGPALAWEYLRNVGIDGAKPDLHLQRFFGCYRMGLSVSEKASNKEIINEIKRLSKETGYTQFEIDALIWNYCADGLGQICTAEPKCNKCVIREYCKMSGSKNSIPSKKMSLFDRLMKRK